MNSSVFVLAMGASLPPPSPSLFPTPLPLTGVPLGALYILGTTPGTYCSSKWTYRQMPCITVWKRTQRVRRRETISDRRKQPDNRDLETLQARLISSTSTSSSLALRVVCLSACGHCGVEVWCSDTMLLLMSLLLMGLDCLLGAPTSREVYRMPQSALKGTFLDLHQFFLINYGNMH